MTASLSRSQIMARVRSRNTEPEQRLRKALWRLGLRYRLGAKLPGSPDIVFVSARIAIFVDGCFWHNCPIHGELPVTNREYWQAKITRNEDRDRRVDEELQHLGWNVLRVWEHDIDQNVESVAEQIGYRIRQAMDAA